MKHYKYIIKKTSMSFGANIFSILVSSFLTFVIPKYFGVSQYGYWQLYLFYASYCGIFHFGIQDGIFLRYGGQYYKTINKELLHSQFVIFMMMEMTFSIIVISIATMLIQNHSELFVWYGFAFCLVIYLPNTFMQYLMQSTGRVKEYAIALILEKFVIFILAMGIIIARIEKFQYLIIADLSAKFLALIYIIWQNHSIVFGKWLGIHPALQETKANLTAGFFLLIANLTDSLILGFTRLAIKTFWNIQVFAHISLVLNFYSFILIFIIATAQIIYPELKRTDPEKLSFFYQLGDKVILLTLFFIPILYSPIKNMLSAWLPEYAISFRYMIFIIPMCIFQSKSILLLSTFYKVMRKERNLLLVNLASVGIAFIMMSLAIRIFHSITLTMAAATISILFRCLMQELFLKKILNTKIGFSLLSEFMLGLGFILLHLYAKHMAFYIYSICYALTSINLLKSIKRMWKKT